MEQEGEVVIVTNVYGDICIRKARRKRQKLLVRELFYDYANNTTLHGLPYVTKTGLTLIEKIFWLLTFLTSVSLCLFLISKVWFKWQTSPVIVTVSEQLVPVSMVPFPSVTICPQSKCKASVYNYTAEKVKINTLMRQKKGTLNSTMKEQIAKFSGITQICGIRDYSDFSEIYPNKYSDSAVFKNIYHVAPKHQDVFAMCAIHGQEALCEDLFNVVVTAEGICYNMNSLAANEIFRTNILQKEYPYLYANKSSEGWSMIHGYNFTPTTDDKLKNPSYYPLPGAENGASPDVQVILKDITVDRDDLCNGINSGFKVYIQHPADLPQSSLYYYAVLNSQVSSMALSFSVLNTSETLRGYDPEIRQCYFPDERYLKYFSLYTANNCWIECLSNITYKTCGCVQFYMPHNTSKRICTAANEACVMRARDKLQLQESGMGSSRCHCLPSCMGVDYEAEILKTEYNLKKFIESYKKLSNKFDDSLAGLNFSKLEMYFKRPRFLSMRRSELFGLIDFLANCGGLLGLFLGFSFLSLVEIFYFLTLRLCCTLKKDLEEEKSKAVNGKEVQVEKY